ncbi:MAG: 1-acyl-sn-glycerol-3-phosphate acyltransferase [Planctomycetes bacterium]|nr:1-acyl-sn-glycerol-3-phosphate acyltransferase [Planctomycetota bacterium]
MPQLPLVDDIYQTTPETISWLSRTFPSLVFYARWIANVYRSSAQAKRSQYGDQEWVDSSLEVLRSLERVGVQIEVRGLRHLQQLDSPCVIVGNHMSALETAILPGLVQPLQRVTFVVKSSLLDYPFFKHVMRSRDPIAVSQTDPRRDLKSMLEGGLKRLEQGISIVIFPQGQRTTTFDPTDFNKIGIKLAKRAGVPIIPLALQTDAWGIGSIISDFGKIDPTKKVYFTFGEPIEVTGRGTDQHEAILQFIAQNLKSWGN